MSTLHGPWPIPFILDPYHLALDATVAFIVSALLAIMINAEGQAWVSTILGDVREGAKDRFHFNAFFHLDVTGCICYLVAGFGWPKHMDIDASKFKNMDSEPDKQVNNEKKHKNSDPLFNGGNVLSTTRVRRGSINHVKTNRFIFNYHFIFLPIISLILWGIYVFI